MKIDKPFNKMTLQEYRSVYQNRSRYKNFNVLGLYRSLTETEKLTLAEKLQVLEMVNENHAKTFEFLQVKDPVTYFQLATLGREMTRGDEYQMWDDIRKNQERILKSKRIKHRNFGEHSKHNCGNDHCPLNGLMVRKGQGLSEMEMHWHSDQNRSGKVAKASRIKSARKHKPYLKLVEEAPAIEPLENKPESP